MGLRDEELLRRFVACRDAGDADGARRCWVGLIDANHDRIRAMVDLRASRYRLSPTERDDAVQLALVNLWKNMVRTFKGSTMGEWVLSTRQLVDFACRQVQRDAAKRSGRQTSLDAGTGDSEAANPDWKLDELSWQKHRRDEERGEASDFVAWALPQVDDERQRVVIERTLDGVPAEDIAQELDVTVANLYKIRERAVKSIGRLWPRWEGS